MIQVEETGNFQGGLKQKMNNQKGMRKIAYLFFLVLVFAAVLPVKGQQRFPKPEFESGYTQPKPVTPEPRSLAMEYVDVAVLLLVLSLTTQMVLKKRSRQGILWISVFSMIYFGFYREGCICSVGSIQNVVLTFFDPEYAISVTALLFFLLPLVFSLFFGRVFCAGACPLGTIQDLVIIKPLSLPSWLRKTLGLLPAVYLALAVLFAATKTDFIICRYDPFVGIYRMDAPFHMIILGASFLLMGMFVARPYCRFLCPYGVLLNWTSRFSRKHLSITPSNCIKCRLCTTSCPFDAIDHPTQEKTPVAPAFSTVRFIFYALLIPAWVAAGAFAGYRMHTYVSKANPDVYLAELILTHPELKNDPDNIDIQTFLASGKSFEKLVDDATRIRKGFKNGTTAAGAFIGFMIGLTLLNTFVFRRKNDFQPNRGECFSCSRCMDFCPVGK